MRYCILAVNQRVEINIFPFPNFVPDILGSRYTQSVPLWVQRGCACVIGWGRCLDTLPTGLSALYGLSDVPDIGVNCAII